MNLFVFLLVGQTCARCAISKFERQLHMRTLILSTAFIATTAGFVSAQTADPRPSSDDSQVPMIDEATPAAPIDPIVPPADPGVSPDATTASSPSSLTDPALASSRDGYSAALTDAVTSSTLTGAAVYSSEDEHIGDISEFILNADGKTSDVIVDIGGFLGIGAKSVSLPIAEVEILQENDGDSLRVYAPMSREQLVALPEHGG